MKTDFDPAQDQLHVTFEATSEAADLAAGIERDLGFMARLSHCLPLHHSVNVVFTSTPGKMTARVAQVFEKGPADYATAFLVDDPSAAAQLLAAPVEPDEVSDGEIRGTSPIHRIKQMNPKQRSLLALKAGRTERKILLRDKTPQVLQNLLNNPHIDSEEVLQIARSSHVVAPLLQRIASDARWSANQEIVTAVVRHPRTPTQVATRLLPALRTTDLRWMAKMSSGLKEAMRKAALREYMRRTGQRI